MRFSTFEREIQYGAELECSVGDWCFAWTGAGDSENTVEEWRKGKPTSGKVTSCRATASAAVKQQTEYP